MSVSKEAIEAADEITELLRDYDNGSTMMNLTKLTVALQLSWPKILSALSSSPGKDGGQEPVLFVSEQQLPTCVGTYLPTRKHREGNFQMPLYARPQPASTALVERAAVADQIIGQIEERFPNWRSYRDLIDCIDCTLHELRKDARS